MATAPNSKLFFTPDPTFLWNFTDLIVPYDFNLPAGKIAGVAVADHDLKARCAAQLGAAGYHVINLLGEETSDAHNLPSHLTFNERLGIYSHFSFFVTDRFHGAIQTLKLSDSPVLFIEPASYYPKPNGKGRDLFQRLGIQQMFVRCESASDVHDAFIADFIEKSRLTHWPLTREMDELKKQAEQFFAEMDRTLLV